MRKDLFDQLVESVKEMKAMQAGKRKPARVTRADDLVRSGTPDVAAGAPSAIGSCASALGCLTPS